MFYDMFGTGPHVTPNQIRGAGVKEVKEIKEASIVNPFKKQFMPTSWKWFRTSGASRVYTYKARRGEITTLEVKIPKQYTPFVVDSAGKVFPSTNGNFKIVMEGDTNDYFTTGDRASVIMTDAEPNGTLVYMRHMGGSEIPQGARLATNTAGGVIGYYSTPPNPPITTTFPVLKFRSDGVDYSLDWNLFSQKRNISRGASGQDWGYPKEGRSTYGGASAYDSEIKLTWNNKFKWWWLAIAAGVGYGIYSLFRKQ